MRALVRVVWCLLLHAACAAPGAGDADGGRWGLTLPVARLDPQPLPVTPSPTVDGGDGLAVVSVPLQGPAGEQLIARLRRSDGGVVSRPGPERDFRVEPLARWTLELALDGGTSVELPLDTGRPGSSVTIDERLVRPSRGLRLASQAPGAAPPWNDAWIHRGTGSVIVWWGDTFIELARDDAAPSRVRRHELGPAPASPAAPCLPREGTVVFVGLSTGTIAWDVATHRRVEGLPPDLSPAVCLSARKGVPRAALALAAGGLSVVEWSATTVREVFREAGPLRPAFSADGTTAGFVRQGAAPSGWVAERIVLATGVRTPQVVQGPGDPMLPSDGSALLVLASPQPGGAWQPCTQGGFCELHGATAQPLSNVVGLAVADAAPKLLVAQRLAGPVDRLLQVDLTTGAQVPFTPPGHLGLPAKRWVLRGNLLPLDRGIANALTATAELTGSTLLTSTVSHDGSVWATVASSGAPAGRVEHEGGALSRGPFLGVPVVQAPAALLGRAAVTRSLIAILGGATTDLRWSDAACFPYSAGEVYRRDGTPLTQSLFCAR